MNEIEVKLNVMKFSYVMPIGFVAVGVVFLGYGIYLLSFPFILVGTLIAALGGFMYKSTKDRNTSVDFMIANYQKNPEKVLMILDKFIESINKSIDNEMRKANAGGKDAKDSYKDAERKTRQLENYLKIRELVENNYLNKGQTD